MAQALSSSSRQMLREEKEDFWSKHSGIPDEAIQAMWMEALCSAAADTVQSNHWGRDVPRSLSTGGQSQGFYYTVWTWQSGFEKEFLG